MSRREASAAAASHNHIPAESWPWSHRSKRTMVSGTDCYISDLSAERLDQIAADLEREHGYQLGYAFVRRIHDSPDRATAEEAAAVARRLHDKWGVGHKEKGDGVLVFLSLDDRRAYISTGSKAKERLPDLQCVRIIDSARPLLRRGDYDLALIKIAERISDRLAKSSSESVSPSAGAVAFGGIAAAVLLYERLASRAERKEQDAARAALQELQKLRHEGGHTGEVCALCFEPVAHPWDGLLRCGHNFHRRCLEAEGYKSLCPVCGAPASKHVPGAAHGMPVPPAAAGIASEAYTAAAMQRIQERYAGQVGPRTVDAFWAARSPFFYEPRSALWLDSRDRAAASQDDSGSSSWSGDFGGGDSSDGGGGGSDW